MKNKTENIEKPSVLKELRKIRDTISLEIMNMNKEEMKAYFAKRRTLHPTSYKRNTRERNKCKENEY